MGEQFDDRPARDGIAGKLTQLVRWLLQPPRQDASKDADRPASASVCRECRSSLIRRAPPASNEEREGLRWILLRCSKCHETHVAMLSDETARCLQRDLERGPHPPLAKPRPDA
jgi:hypothetical protein